MNKTEFIRELEKLDLPGEEYIILSGGSLLMRGLREQTSDLDITVSRKLAQELALYSCPRDEHGLYTPFENVQMMDDMESFSYDIVDGYPCESLEDILRQKRQWDRPKDRKDIDTIEAFLRKKHEETAGFYSLLTRQGRELVSGIPYLTANLANLSALIWQMLDRINWAGFYLAKGEKLILGPFQGKPACIEIPFGKGVCGTAAWEDRTVLVRDVHKFPGHIACDSASRSEIVVPVHAGGKVWGVLDIDSPEPGRFTKDDQEGLERFAHMLEEILKADVE